MNQFEEKMREFLKKNNINAEHSSFDKCCHSVKEAVSVTGSPANFFTKSICMIDSNNNLIVAIVRADYRASTKRVAKALKLSENPRVATPKEVLEKTGFQCGGTPFFGYSAKFLIDPLVMENEWVYTGGGSEFSLVKISISEIKKLDNCEIVRVRK